jgi:hypothetical protein
MAAVRLLLKRCHTGENLPKNVWSDEEIEAVGQSMSAADPLAEILLSFDCPSCGAHFEESLDLPSFLWSEIECCAKRLLFEVHTLASAYGWSQAEVLSLSPARRKCYLNMARA